MLREMTATSTALLIGSANAARACGSDPLLQPLEVVFIAGAVGATIIGVITLVLAVAKAAEGFRAKKNPAPGFAA